MEESKHNGVEIFVCGPSSDKCKCQCPNGPCEHKWDGPWKEFDDGLGATVTCSRCGMDAMQHSLWIAP